MNHEQRLELIRRVLQTAYNETETWQEEDNVGAALAYLCLAIAANDSKSHVNWALDHRGPVLALFRNWFTDDDLVWKFIRTDDAVSDEERSNGPYRA